MKITNIKTYMARFGGRSRGLIKVETDEGLYGWGESYSVGPNLAAEPIADYIFEMIKGEDPRRIEYIMMKIHQQLRFPAGGVGLAVTSAIDHALWDISGKAANLPVYMLLGGSVRDRIRVYQGVGGRDGQEAGETAHRLNEEGGFTAFKTSPYPIEPDANRWDEFVLPLLTILRGFATIHRTIGSSRSTRTPRSLSRFVHYNYPMRWHLMIPISTKNRSDRNISPRGRACVPKCRCHWQPGNPSMHVLNFST